MTIRNFTTLALGWFLMILSGTLSAWTIIDNYDGDTLNANPCGGFGGAPWRKIFISMKQSASPPHSCEFVAEEGNDSFGASLTTPILAKGEELWFQFKIFMPAGFDYGAYGAGDKKKFIAIGVRTASGTSTTLFIELNREDNGQPPYAHGLTSYNKKYGPNFWTHIGDASNKPMRGVWETYETYVKFDEVPVDYGGTGRVRIWKNGLLVGDVTGVPPMNNSTDLSNFVAIHAYWNNGSPKSQSLYVDDLVVTNETPVARDAAGNPYIGVGNFSPIAPPLPPSSIH